jgi:hypothetical protein
MSTFTSPPLTCYCRLDTISLLLSRLSVSHCSHRYNKSAPRTPKYDPALSYIKPSCPLLLPLSSLNSHFQFPTQLLHHTFKKPLSTTNTMDSPTAQAQPAPPSIPPPSAGACPPKSSICNCGTPTSQTYLTPIIGCVNRKCRPRHYHLRCVGLRKRPNNPLTWSCPSCEPDQPQAPRKRKADDSGDDTPSKKARESEDTQSAADVAPAAGERTPTEGPDAEIDAASSSPSAAGDNVVACLPAVGASRDTPNPFADDDDAPTSPEEVASDDEDDDEDEPAPESDHYCIRACRRETGGMVACDGEGCVGEWFHFACVGMTAETVPDGEWFCDECVEK